jgi:protein TonB
MTTTSQLDEFDLLLNDVLRSVANPEMPERLRVNVQTRVWVRLATTRPTLVPAAAPAVRPTPVFAPATFYSRMEAKRSTPSTIWAIVLHAAALLFLFFVAGKHMMKMVARNEALTELSTPPLAPAKPDIMGGGGGHRGPTPVTKGAPPKFAETQIVPPKAPPMEEPKIKIDPTIEVQKDLKMTDSKMPNFGMPNSPLVGTSMGNGSGTGLGSGNGSGLGPGSGGNTGGGPKHIGGGISAPQLVFSVEPEYSEEARKAKASGNVLVNLWVDEKGNPTHIRVLRGVGLGLDEKAVAAVKMYKFKPALEDGKPVTVELNVEVNFQIL